MANRPSTPAILSAATLADSTIAALPLLGGWPVPLLLSILMMVAFFEQQETYLAFAEIAPAVLDVCIFVLVWGTWRFVGNSFYLLLGCGLLAVALLGAAHTLIEAGNVTPVAGYAFRLGGRLLEAITWLLALLFCHRQLTRPALPLLFALLAALIWTLPVLLDLWPAALPVAGGGALLLHLAEFLPALLTLAALALLWRGQSGSPDRRALPLLAAAMLLSVVSTLLERGANDDISRLISHLCELFSSWFVLTCTIDAVLTRPFTQAALSAHSYSHLPFQTVALDATGRIMDANAAAESWCQQQFGHTARNRRCHPLFHDGLPEGSCPICQAIVRKEELSGLPMFDAKRQRWYEISLTRFGHSDGFIQTMLDVTEARAREQRLQATEERMRLALEASNQAIWDWRLADDQLTFSSQFEPILGLRLGTFADGSCPRTRLDELIHPDDLFRFQVAFSQISSSRSRKLDLECRVLPESGGYIWVLWRGQVVEFSRYGRPARVAGTLLDISERKRLEISLRENEAKYSSLLEKSHDGIAIIQNGVLKFTNRRLYEMCDYPAGSMLGKHITSFVTASHRASLWSRYDAQAVRRNDLADTFEVDLATRTGQSLRVEISSSRLDYMGHPADLAIVRDISARLKAEAELRKLSQAVMQMDESVLISDRNGIIEFVNPAFSRITGYQPEEVIGKTPAILRSGEHDNGFYRDFWGTITSGKTWHGEVVDKRKGGKLYPALMSVSPLVDDRGEISHFVAVQQDLSEREVLEEKFRQAQKMEALGTLVGGIAHDFNNMLAGMMGNLFLARMQAEENRELIAKLTAVEELGYRAADMVKQLLAFARKGKVDMRPIAFPSFLREAMRLAIVSISEDVEVVQQISPEPMVVRGDTTQLQQMLMNLLSNAHDAVRGSIQPRLEITLSRYLPTEEFLLANSHLSASSFALLRISDNGYGIAKRDLEQIFEPFFTTKEVGKGTGLGLAMVYGAVQTHKGAIEVASTIGRGTSFSLYFPLIETADVEAKPPQQEQPVNRGREHLLLVDDDPSVRQTHREVLKSLGYQISEACNGQEAVDLCGIEQIPYDLLMIDVVMPVMNGDEAARQIRARHPHLPILFVTGYDREQVAQDDMPEGSALLTKPVAIKTLATTLRQLIDSAKS